MFSAAVGVAQLAAISHVCVCEYVCLCVCVCMYAGECVGVLVSVSLLFDVCEDESVRNSRWCGTRSASALLPVLACLCVDARGILHPTEVSLTPLGHT